MRGMLMSIVDRPEIEVSTERRPTAVKRSTPSRGALGIRYRPLPPVTARASEPWTTTVTLGIGPPSGDVTVPTSVPRAGVCADAVPPTTEVSTRLTPAARRHRSRMCGDDRVRGSAFIVDGLSVSLMSRCLHPGSSHGSQALHLAELRYVVVLMLRARTEPEIAPTSTRRARPAGSCLSLDVRVGEITETDRGIPDSTRRCSAISTLWLTL